MAINTFPSVANQPLPRTGQAFLRRIHGPDWTDIWVASSDGWGGGRAGDIITGFPVSTGHYYSAAHIRKGATTRSNATFESLWAIVIDDVGTSPGSNLDLDEHRLLLPEPTAIIETSENNFQWLYALTTPEPDVAKIGAAFAALKLHPLLGPGFKDTADLTHYFRLPGGVNPKPGKESFSTACRELDLGNRYEFDQLMLAFGIDLPAAMAAAPVRGAPASTTYTQMPVAVLRGMLARIVNDLDRNTWLRVAHSLMSATEAEPDKAREIWVEWSATHVPKDGRTPAEVVKEAERVWDTLPDDHYATVESLILLLEERSASYKDRVVNEKEGFTEANEKRAEAAVNDIASIAKLKDEAKEIDDLIKQLRKIKPIPALYANEPDPGGRATIRPFVAHRPKPPFPAYPILFPGYVRGYAMMLSGTSGLGKSAFTVALTNAITHNAPHILNCGSVNPKLLGDVVIISNEDAETEIERRIYASQQHHKLGGQLHEHYITPATGLASKGSDGVITLTCAPLLRELIALREKRDIALIVIDTLASVLDGLDENSVDMQGAMRQFMRIAWAAWACVVVVHHPTKAAGEDDALKRTQVSLRGSGSLPAAIRSGTTISTPTQAEREEFGFTPAQMDSIVAHTGFKNSWGRKAPRTFFNRISAGVDLVDMDGQSEAGDVVVLEYYSPTPRSMAADLSAIRRAFGKAMGPVRYDPAHTKPSQASDSLEKLSGLSLKRLKELVPLLEADGKVRVLKKKVSGNPHMVIEIVKWDEEKEEDEAGVP